MIVGIVIIVLLLVCVYWLTSCYGKLDDILKELKKR